MRVASTKTAALVKHRFYVRFFLGVILLNTILLAIEYYNMPTLMDEVRSVRATSRFVMCGSCRVRRQVLTIFNIVFTILFTIELLLAVFGLGVKHLLSLSSLLDVAVVVSSLVEVSVRCV